MKRLLHHLWILPAMAALCTACSTDEIEPSTDNPVLWEGSLEAAPYEKDAVCFVTPNAELDGRKVEQVELAASGLYYITLRDDSNSYNRPAMLRKPKAATRDWLPYQNIVTGDFTPLGDNRYRLDKFGILTINADGTITVGLDDGRECIWQAVKSATLPMDALNSRVCRTWQLYDGHIDFLDADLRIVYSINVPHATMVESDYIYAITFTSASRVYRQDEPDDYWYGGNWKWINQSEQIMELVSDDPSDGEGMFQVLFKNDMLEIMNPWDFNDYGSYGYFEGLPGAENIPDNTRYAREYINLKALRTSL